jgi:hypothetical protein
VDAVYIFLKKKCSIKFDDIKKCKDKDSKKLLKEIGAMEGYANMASVEYKESKGKPTLLFIYYSGHGKSVSNETYLVNG